MFYRSTFRFILFTALVLVTNARAFALEESGRELNRRDESGRKQGYWVIKGFMSNEAEYSPNSIVEEGTYTDDRKEGLWKRYFPNGNVKSEITYSADRPNGPYTVYYVNGQVEERGNWARNKNTGEFRRFHDNGKPQQVFYFSEKGIRNGTQHYYHENGQLALEVNLVEGKEEGRMRRWDEKGKLTEEKDMKGGILVPGSIKRYDSPASGEKPIATTEAPKNAPVATDKTNQAEKFKPNGYNVLYDSNQQISQVGEFKNGRLWNGKWNRYNSDGILIRTEIYKSGRFVGNGVLETED
jgi:antitoxin component YwqK of YwqJK toxin-antitoxin module